MDRRHFCVLYEKPRARRVNRDPQKINASASRRDELSASFMGTMSNSRVIFTCGNALPLGKVERRWRYVQREMYRAFYSSVIIACYNLFLIEKLVFVEGGG